MGTHQAIDFENYPRYDPVWKYFNEFNLANLFFVQFLNCSTQMKIVFCFLFCPVRHFTFVKCLPIKMSSWTQPHFFFGQSCCDRNLRGLCNTKILGWKVALMIVFHLFLRQHFYYIFRRIKMLYDLTSSSKNFLFVY